MHGKTLPVHQDVLQPAQRHALRPLLRRKRQVCYLGHSSASAIQQHVARDAVTHPVVVGQAQQPALQPQNNQELDVTGSVCNSTECNATDWPRAAAEAPQHRTLLHSQFSQGSSASAPSCVHVSAVSSTDTHGGACSSLQLQQRAVGVPLPQQEQLGAQHTASTSPVPKQADAAHQQASPHAQQASLQRPADTVDDAGTTDAAREYQKNISRSLRSHNCDSFEVLEAIVADHGPGMDGQSVASSFTAVARLAKLQQQGYAGGNNQAQQQRQAVMLLEQQLLPLLQSKLHQLDAAGLQVVLFTLASLGYRDESAVLLLESAITPVAGQLAPGRLCQLLWSLGQLGLKPQPQLLWQVLRSSSRAMSSLQGQDLCQMLQALVLLQLQPPDQWLDQCCARVLQLCAHKEMEPRALCSTLHSLARLVSRQRQQQQAQEVQLEAQQQEQHPPASWLPHSSLLKLLAAAQDALQQTAAGVVQQTPVTSQCLANAKQEQQEGQPAQQLYNQQQDRLVIQHRSLTSMHSIQCSLPMQLQQQAVLSRMEQGQDQPRPAVAAALTPAGLNMLADALRLLKTDPPPAWQDMYAAAAQQLMNVSDARNLPLMLAPLIRWRKAPGESWMQQYLAACEHLLPSMQAQGLAVLGHSLTALNVQPSPAWLHAYLTAASSCRLEATPAGCSFLLHTLGSWKQLGCLYVAQSAETAAVDQQLGAMAQSLASKCVHCFVDNGHSFTAEQLGMFCRGLALWGLRGTPQLAQVLHQVVMQRLSQHVGRQERLTAATLCNVLMALAVACPGAAAPALMVRLWSVWSAWLLPSTTAAQAAAVAWASARLHVQLPEPFAQGLLQHLAVVAAEEQLQHLAAVVMQAKQECWPVQQHDVVVLLGHILRKQASELSAMQLRCAPAEPQLQQEQQQEPQDAEHSGRLCEHLQEIWAGTSKCTSGTISSSNSNTAAARLFGLANHRLKSWLTSAAATAAWCDALSLQQLQAALCLYAACAAVLPQDQQRVMQAHIRVMKTEWRARSVSFHRRHRAVHDGEELAAAVTTPKAAAAAAAAVLC